MASSSLLLQKWKEWYPILDEKQELFHEKKCYFSEDFLEKIFSRMFSVQIIFPTFRYMSYLFKEFRKRNRFSDVCVNNSRKNIIFLSRMQYRKKLRGYFLQFRNFRAEIYENISFWYLAHAIDK
jgi:hypothetical protein